MEVDLASGQGLTDLTSETAAQEALLGGQPYPRSKNEEEAVANFNAAVEFYLQAAAEDGTNRANVNIGKALNGLITQLRDSGSTDVEVQLMGSLASDNFKAVATQAKNPGMANMFMLAREVASYAPDEG